MQHFIKFGRRRMIKKIKMVHILLNIHRLAILHQLESELHDAVHRNGARQKRLEAEMTID